MAQGEIEMNALTVNGKQLTVDGVEILGYEDIYNPLGLPANTLRIKFSQGYTPTKGDTKTLVDAEQNIWDIYIASNDWSSFYYDTDGGEILDVMGANTTNVTSLFDTFHWCIKMTHIALFDTRNVIAMEQMLLGCEELTAIPPYDVTNVYWINEAFSNCYKVETGALAMYQKLSAKQSIGYHIETFCNCGRDTVSGAAELAQIPSSWGGTGA